MNRALQSSTNCSFPFRCLYRFLIALAALLSFVIMMLQECFGIRVTFSLIWVLNPFQYEKIKLFFENSDMIYPFPNKGLMLQLVQLPWRWYLFCCFLHVFKSIATPSFLFYMYLFNFLSCLTQRTVYDTFFTHIPLGAGFCIWILAKCQVLDNILVQVSVV